MFTQFEANERHYLKIIEIQDNTHWDKPCVTLRCRGVIASRDRNKDSGIATDIYSCTVRAYPPLSGYILNELSEGDEIYLIGHSAMASVNGYPRRVTVAEQIYKAEWTSYFTDIRTRDGTRWKDCGYNG